MAQKLVKKLSKKETARPAAKLGSKLSSKSPAELFDLEIVVGQFMEYWGFKRIHGRIWTHLFTSKLPLDSIELMARLKVSKGLMSLAIRDLLDYGVIKTDHVGRHGSAFYIANPDLMTVISNVLKKRELKMLSDAKKASENLMKIKPEKLKGFNLDIEKIQSVLELTNSGQLLLQMFLEQDQSQATSLMPNNLLKSF